MYHCFDRVVIHGYLSGLSRPGQVVHFFRDVVGETLIREHRGPGSKGSRSVANVDALPAQARQDLINFLRSL